MADRGYFIHQQIQNLASVLKNSTAKISSCQNTEEINIGIEELNKDLMTSLNINLDEIANIALEHFIASITVDNILDNQNLELLAELFYHTGKAYQRLEEKEMAKRILNRSLIIFKFLLKIETDFPYERHLRIKELSEILLQ